MNRNLNRLRNRIASLRDMPVLYAFNDHPLQPRFTMHRRGELTVSIVEDGDKRRPVGLIKQGETSDLMWIETGANVDMDARQLDELLGLARSIYQTLLTKYNRKRQ